MIAFSLQTEFLAYLLAYLVMFFVESQRCCMRCEEPSSIGMHMNIWVNLTGLCLPFIAVWMPNAQISTMALVYFPLDSELPFSLLLRDSLFLETLSAVAHCCYTGFMLVRWQNVSKGDLCIIFQLPLSVLMVLGLDSTGPKYCCLFSLIPCPSLPAAFPSISLKQFQLTILLEAQKCWSERKSFPQLGQGSGNSLPKELLWKKL
jgi:hypothetical protein